jgi:hypothetical protein
MAALADGAREADLNAAIARRRSTIRAMMETGTAYRDPG